MDDKLFSITMTEEELSLFSEFLEQREYAGRTPGLSPKGQRIMASGRRQIAKDTWKARRMNTPEAYEKDYRSKMRKAGYPKHYIDNEMQAAKVRGDFSKLTERGRDSILTKNADKKSLLEFRAKELG